MRYWVYINEQVSDVPYTKEELSSLPGMTAQTLICAENAASGQEPQWVEASTVLGPYFGASSAEPAPVPQSAPYAYDNRAYQTQYAQQQYPQQYPQPQYQQYPQYTQFSGMPFGQQTQYNPYYQGPQQQVYARQNPFAAQQFTPQQNPSPAPQPAPQQDSQQVLLLDQLGALTKELQSMRKELAALQDENASLRDELSGKDQYKSPKKYAQRPEDLAKENMPKPFMMDEDTLVDISAAGNKKKHFYGGQGEEDSSAPVPVELTAEAEVPTISETVEDIDMDKVEEDVSEQSARSENIIENAINTTIMNRNHFSVTRKKTGGNIVDLTGKFDKKEKAFPKKIQEDEDVTVEEIEETPVPVKLEKYKNGKKVIEEEIIEESDVPEGEVIEEEIVDESEVPEGEIIEEVQEVSEEKMPSAQTIEEKKVEESLYAKEQLQQAVKDTKKEKHLGDYGKHKEEMPQEITLMKLAEEGEKPFSEKASKKEVEIKNIAGDDEAEDILPSKKDHRRSAKEEEAPDLTDIPSQIPPAEEIKEEETPVPSAEEEKSSKGAAAAVSEEEDNSEIEKSDSAEEVSVLEEFAADKETGPKEEEYPELEESPLQKQDMPEEAPKPFSEKKEDKKPAETKPLPKKEETPSAEKKEEAKPLPKKEEEKEDDDDKVELRGAIPDKIPSLKEEGIKSFAELEASDEIDEKALAEAQEIDDKFLKTFTTNIEEVFLDQPTSIISDYVPPAVADDDYVVGTNGASAENQEAEVKPPQEIIDIKANPQVAQAGEDMRNVRRIKPAAIKTVPMVPGATGEVPLSNVPNIEEAIAELHGKTSVFKVLKMFSAVFALIVVALLFVAFLSTMGIMSATKSPIHMIAAKVTGKKIEEKAPAASSAAQNTETPTSSEQTQTSAPAQQVSSSTAAAGAQTTVSPMDRSAVLQKVKTYDLGGGLTLEKKINLIYPKVRPMWVLDQGFNPEDFSVAAKMPENNEGYSQVYRFNYNIKDSQLIPTTTEARNIISMPVEELQKLMGPKKFNKTPQKKGSSEQQSIVKVE